ncbi:MAG: hypothetical protein ACFB20_07685 [Opitutales bacterium]
MTTAHPSSEPAMTAPPPSLPASPYEREARKDFGDWISPLLVKELRQALRSRIFISVFLILQVALVYFVIQYAFAEQTSDRFLVFFWLIVGLALLLLVPLMGTSAVASEFGGSKLELLTLSRTSARGIVRGKWLALYGQALLMAVTLLPYMVIRYYVGDVQLVQEMQTLTFLLLASAVLTAGAIALSTIRNRALRFILSVGAFVGLVSLTLGWGFQAALRPSGDVLEGSFWLTLGWGLLFAIPTVLLLWEMAASQFAPLAENHETPKRLLGFFVVFASLALTALDYRVELTTTIVVVVLALISVDAILRDPVPIATIYRPFVRRGMLARLSGRLLLYPGDASGVLYVSVTWTLLLGVSYLLRGDYQDPRDFIAIAVLPATVGMFIIPAAIRVFWRPRSIPAFWQFVLIHVAFALLSGLLADQADNSNTTFLAGFIPTLYLSVAPDIVVRSLTVPTVISIAMTGVSLAICLIGRRPVFSAFLNLERAADDLNQRAVLEAAQTSPKP